MIKQIKIFSGIHALIIILSFFVACKNYNDVPYAYKSPEKLNDNLQVANISVVNIDSAPDLSNYQKDQRRSIRGKHILF